MPKRLPTSTVITQTLAAQAKALYTIKGLSGPQIALKLGVPTGTIQSLIRRGAWSADRQRRMQLYERTVLSRAEDANAAFLESMATQSEELAEDGMQMAREVVHRRDDFAAKDFASATQGVKNLVEIFRKVRGIDGSSGGAGVTIGAMFINAQSAPQRPLKNADSAAQEQAIDVSTQPIQEANRQ